MDKDKQLHGKTFVDQLFYYLKDKMLNILDNQADNVVKTMDDTQRQRFIKIKDETQNAKCFSDLTNAMMWDIDTFHFFNSIDTYLNCQYHCDCDFKYYYVGQLVTLLDGIQKYYARQRTSKNKEDNNG